MLFLPSSIDILAVGDRLPHVGVTRQRVARLVHVGEHDGIADPQRAGVGLLLTGDHAEQRRLAGAVRADHADDPGRRQLERQVLDQQIVAVALLQMIGLDHHVAEPRPGRNVDFDVLEFLRALFGQHLLVSLKSRLALGLSRARGHAHPFQLALERLLAGGFGLLLLGEARALLLEPRGVVALPRNAGATIELENPAGHVVEEVAIVRHRHHRARIFLEEALEPRHRLGVEVVGGLVEQQQVGPLTAAAGTARRGDARRPRAW